MLNLKVRYIYLVILALTSCGYFSTISNLDINDFWQGEMVLIPLQLIAVIYLIYLRGSKQNNSAKL